METLTDYERGYRAGWNGNIFLVHELHAYSSDFQRGYTDGRQYLEDMMELGESAPWAAAA